MTPSEHEKHDYRGFWALIIAQFQAAFNDNAYKLLLTLLAMDTLTDPKQQKDATSAMAALFILPFLFFSMYGGQCADRFSKRSIAMITKLSEIGIMGLGIWAMHTGNLWFGSGVLLLLGTHSAFFGPAKYGIIPELVPEKKLSWANGILELSTFLAIIGGTGVGTALYGMCKGFLYAPVIGMLALSVCGAWVAVYITKVPAAAPERPLRANFISDVWRNLMYARQDRVLWLAVLGNTYFWFIASVVYLNVYAYGPHVLHLKTEQLGYLLVSLAMGIGLGSFLAGYLSGNKIEYGFIPFGALVVTASGCDLYRPGLSLHHALFSLAMLGLGSGFFIVPIQALVQHRPEPTRKGRVQGMAYFFSNVGTLAASGIYTFLTTIVLKLDPRQVFLVLGLMTLIVAGYVLWLLPDSFLRLVLWLFAHSIYRMRILGRDNIPVRGGALFVCNHVSFADALFVTASTERHVRFIMHADYYNHPFYGLLGRMLRAIPISSTGGPRAIITALREASRAIQNGDVVCIFAEGEITRTGQLLPFRRGFERIMQKVDAPVVPMHLDRVWGSIFSFEKGRFLWKLPHRIPYPMTVSYGEALGAKCGAAEARRAVQELATAAAIHHSESMTPLHREYIHQVRSHPFRFAMADGKTPDVSYGSTLVRSIVLARRLRETWKDQEMVGLLVPPSVAGACLNIAALLSGRVPVNLNYTASQESLDSAIEQCRIRSIVTARAFLEKIKVKPSGDVVYLEDIAASITIGEKIIAQLMAMFLPARVLETMLGMEHATKLDALATIIFSSGSTGDPKGVMLSHYNLLSNIEGTAQVMSVGPKDRILGVLPFFHSFGFMGTLWFPLVRGFGVVYHPNPMDARVIGALVEKYGATLLVATPTFMQAYVRRVQPGQFGSLRFVIAGAEKLPERVAVAFEDKFGIRPYEAYGTTECSPAVTINVPGYRARGFYQVGAKRASIGHPLPGVSVRVVDPESLEPLAHSQPGMLLIKGPNVMMGYLGKPEKSAEVIRDGWYVTGDIGAIDDDGFVAITDRLSRFSKIGGEMVPHVKVEEALHELAGATQQVLAVTAVPDERKGEKLVVLHTLNDEDLQDVLQNLNLSGLPNLWVPRADAFIKVDAIPVLGTGKMDLRQIRQMALSAMEQ